MIDVEPTRFDFDAEPDPPDWIVDGVLERGTIVALSGDTASGKSFVTFALTTAAMRGKTWLGRKVKPSRVLYLDFEMSPRVARDRLRAFGMTNEQRSYLAYYSRPEVLLGESESDAWLVRAANHHRADIVIVDTVTSGCDADLNSNTDAVAFYRKLRPVADSGALVLVLLHERKHTEGDAPRTTKARSMATLGARQWIGQADMAMVLSAPGELIDEPVEDGTRQTFLLDLEMSKLRDGVPPAPTGLVLESERDAEGRYRWIRLGERERQSTRTDYADLILVALSDGKEMRRADLAKAVGTTSQSSALDRALKQLEGMGRVHSPTYGKWASSPSSPVAHI
jgi:hypothetical protein